MIQVGVAEGDEETVSRMSRYVHFVAEPLILSNRDLAQTDDDTLIHVG
jgi:hypothetical protein